MHINNKSHKVLNRVTFWGATNSVDLHKRIRITQNLVDIKQIFCFIQLLNNNYTGNNIRHSGAAVSMVLMHVLTGDAL